MNDQTLPENSQIDSDGTGLSEFLLKIIGQPIDNNSIDDLASILKEKPVVKEIRELDRKYCSFEDSGFCLTMDPNTSVATTIHIYSCESGKKAFKFKLPYNLLFSDSKKTVANKMGKPNLFKSYKGDKHVERFLPHLKDATCLVYSNNDHQMHIEFNENDSIRLITISSAIVSE